MVVDEISMKDIKNIIIVVLIAAVGVLSYMLLVTFPEKAEAECTAVATAQAQEVAQQYEQVLTQLSQVPACAAVMQ